jgi:tetratricopeptide (TPR) repeat protein
MTQMFVCLLFCLAAVFIPSVAASDTVEEACFKSLSLDDRIRACTEFIGRERQSNPKFVEAYYSRASAYVRKDMADEAIADFTFVLARKPNYAQALDGRAWASIKKSRFREAVEDASKAIALKPNYAYAYNNRGLARSGLGDYRNAIVDYTEAIRLAPRLEFAYSNRAFSYVQLRKFGHALADLSYLIAVNPTNPWNYNERANVLIEAGDDVRALADLRAAYARLPESADKSSITSTIQALERRLAGPSVVTPPPNVAINLPKPAPPTRRIALVIGNGRYQSVPALSNPVRDAEAIAASLTRLGFTVRKHTDLDLSGMRRVLIDFSNLASEADWAVIYFAGHGMEMNSDNYLIPTDAKLARDQHVIHETIALQDLFTTVAKAKKFKLIILDACRSNPFLRQIIQTQASVGRGLALVEPPPGIVIAYAARQGRVASDGNDVNSPFAAALLRHVDEPGLEVNFVFRKVRASVHVATAGEQDPFTSGDFPLENFYFNETR